MNLDQSQNWEWTKLDLYKLNPGLHVLDQELMDFDQNENVINFWSHLLRRFKQSDWSRTEMIKHKTIDLIKNQDDQA